MKITTNHQPRELVSFWDLSEDHQSEMDYVNEDDRWNTRFFVYKGEVYDTGEFFPSRTEFVGSSILDEWDGVQTDSFYSAIVIKWLNDYEDVVVGTAIW